MTFSRRTQMITMIFLAGATAFAQYILQGALATGHDPSTFSPIFWYIDWGLWGLRSLIDAWVISYLFVTRATTRTDKTVMVMFEVLLIGLITVTLGPTFKAISNHTTIDTVLAASFGNVDLWYYAIGSYTGLMMAGAGAAYKINPTEELASEPSLEPLLEPLELDSINGTSDIKSFVKMLPSDELPAPATLAAVLNVPASEVVQVYREIRNENSS